MACGNRTPLLVCFLACATFKRFGLSPMVRWFNMLVHTVFPCEVTAGGVKIQHIPDLMSQINVWVYAQSGTLLQYVLLILPFSSHQSNPPQGCSESFPGCHFPKCLRLRSSSALVSQTWCNLPDSNPQPFWFQYHGPVVSRWSFDHSFSPAPY